MATQPKKKTIFEYSDYREFLEAYYTAAKANRKGFSFRVFARMAGYSSPSTLKRVTAGERNLTPDGVERFAKALKLNKQEHEFFTNLVHFNQSRTNAEKQQFAEKLSRSKRFRELHPLSSLQMNYYRNWYYVPVRELVALKSFREDPQWIAEKIDPPISPEEAQKALSGLLQLGLIERRPDGRLVQSVENVSTGNEVVSLFLAQFHYEMTKKAMESIERHPRNKRDISSITVGVSPRTAHTIKEMTQNFRKEVLAVAAQDESPSIVYQLNFQLFPLSKNTDEEK